MTDVRPGHDAGGSGSEGSPWFRAAHQPPRPEEPYQAPGEPSAAPGPDAPYAAPYEAYGAPGAYDAPGTPQDPYAAPQPYASPSAPYGSTAAPQPYESVPAARPYEEAAPVHPAAPDPYAQSGGYEQPGPYEQPRAMADAPAEAPGIGSTAVLPVIDPAADPASGPTGAPAGGPTGARARSRAPRASATPATGPVTDPVTDPAADAVPPRAADDPPTGGRAERRRAAKGRGGRRRGPGAPPPTAPPTASPAGAPLSRVEARRAARAAKDGFGVIASRVMGEIFITFGMVMLLFVAYQLWWTNVQAGLEVDRAKDRIAQDWAKDDADRKPGVFEAGEGFAILHIPKLDVVVPVAEGIDKEKVLDKGMAGHYAEGALKTAMPSDKEGNFAVAGHRNTHGEPFRYINQLKPGDPIVVETREAYYTYEMASILPQTPPSNVSVLKPIPDGSGFTEPGRYITLTTCTPEFTSTYRMIVWGKMVEERPRSKGVPDALAG
ncbi:class E sortase [Streptomyces sp. enrichment culture]|uniref:class E sortase n=1 Tax=Streptomyces sp. enrichment culture TaxID=1795815 RepID=UPI003F55C77F